MSVNLGSLLQQPAACHTAGGEVLSGVLTAVDNDFNCVLAQCTVRPTSAPADEAQAEAEPLTFVRGGNVVYISFTKPSD